MCQGSHLMWDRHPPPPLHLAVVHSGLSQSLVVLITLLADVSKGHLAPSGKDMLVAVPPQRPPAPPPASRTQAGPAGSPHR
eukprot:CAMPEP_0204483902 /NCGR_PEP_ID=MMETSP0471-20130131/55919_1 /ASSEMBLY_ACC=CAM_ASM_000602 /TAXON_ID=2969 /ORGANISM="Oxyrrhis marina" /LENGTH=80 /DNA_ID=CAMNT_0051487275 /DNA_START=92 /DNA_END=330 /DNA_ORIENTATION=+